MTQSNCGRRVEEVVLVGMSGKVLETAVSKAVRVVCVVRSVTAIRMMDETNGEKDIGRDGTTTLFFVQFAWGIFYCLRTDQTLWSLCYCHQFRDTVGNSGYRELLASKK